MTPPPGDFVPQGECSARHRAVDERLERIAASMEQAVADLRAGTRRFAELAVARAEQTGEITRLAAAVTTLAEDVRRHLTAGNGRPPLPVRMAVVEERIQDLADDAAREERDAREGRWRALAQEAMRLVAAAVAGATAGGVIAG